MAQEERRAIIALRKVTKNAGLRQVLSAFLKTDPETSKFNEALRIALSDDKAGAAIAFARRNTTDVTFRRFLNYFLRKEGDPDRLRLALRPLENAAFMEHPGASLAATHWMRESRFTEAYDRAKAVAGWGIHARWRMHVLMTCAERATQGQGDFVECGSDRGGSALCVIGFLGKDAFKKRSFYMFDTFQGLVRSQMDSREAKLSPVKEERYPPVLEEARRNMADYPFVRIVPGIVPESLSAFKGRKIAYLHIDMNVAHPEVSAFEHFWPRLVKGAPVIFQGNRVKKCVTNC